VSFISSTDTVGAKFDMMTLAVAVPAMEMVGAGAEATKFGVDADLMRAAEVGLVYVEGTLGGIKAGALGGNNGTSCGMGVVGRLFSRRNNGFSLSNCY
jgi:alpha-D-ribose 1-methylphosphonate 5-triphosphate synthase subunit PhnG